MKNALNRELPDYIEGYGAVKPFMGLHATRPEAGMRYHGKLVKNHLPGQSKVMEDLKAVFKAIPVTDGMCISFHHALRNGDYVINMVLDTAAELGIKDLKVACTALFPINMPIVDHIKNGVVTALDLPGIVGPVGTEVSKGILDKPVVFRSHGGRPKAICCGELHIDVAFIASPTSDQFGNINGVEGPSACGSLGYAFADAEHADYVVAVTDNLVDAPLSTISIHQDLVDYVVPVEKIGDPKGIVSDVLNVTKDPLQLLIAETAAEVTDALGLIKDGYSFQTGGGGVSLAFAQFITEIMEEREVKASFAMGGITGMIVNMLEKGMLGAIYDNQCFDIKAVESIRDNAQHYEVSASTYANPYNSAAIVNTLDQCILGALEIDTDFNLNVLTGSDGTIRAGIGGNPDTATGSSVTMVVANLLRGRLPVVVDSVATICTPGPSVDVLVTEEGVAVNPLREDLIAKLTEAGIPLVTIEHLKGKAEELAGKPEKIKFTDKIIGVVEYRDGTVLDVVYGIEE